MLTYYQTDFLTSTFFAWICELSIPKLCFKRTQLRLLLHLQRNNELTPWGRVTYTYVGKLTLIQIKACRLKSAKPLSEPIIGIQIFSFRKMRLKMSSAKWRPFCLSLNVIKWKQFLRYWPFVRGIHRSRWIPHTKARDAELWCFLWSAPEYTVE